jgi:hypothetical protein
MAEELKENRVAFQKLLDSLPCHIKHSEMSKYAIIKGSSHFQHLM